MVDEFLREQTFSRQEGTLSGTDLGRLDHLEKRNLDRNELGRRNTLKLDEIAVASCQADAVGTLQLSRFFLDEVLRY